MTQVMKLWFHVVGIEFDEQLAVRRYQPCKLFDVRYHVMRPQR